MKSIKNMIRSIWFRFFRADELMSENQRLRIETDNLNIIIQSLEINLEELRNNFSLEEKKYTALMERVNHIDLPNFNLAELEKKLQLADNYTLKILIDYLALDSYELIKNIASRINKDNIDNFIAYRDGALGRNEELKQFLQKYVSRNENYIDRISGEERRKNGKR